MSKKKKAGSRNGMPLRAFAIFALLCVIVPLTVAQNQWEPGDEWRSNYKIGDRVQLKITDTMWQSCTVIGNVPGSVMCVECEEYVEPPPGTYRRAGGIYTNTSKNDIRPWRAENAAANKPPAQANPNRAEKAGTPAKRPQPVARPGAKPPASKAAGVAGCTFNEPAGIVSKSSNPSAQLFKRVIFEWYRDRANGRKTGITFQTFQLGKAYVNRLTGNGLMHDGAPRNATIYPVKTKFILCERYTDSTIRWGYDAQYSCFKDKFGDWACPSDSTRILQQTYLPNK